MSFELTEEYADDGSGTFIKLRCNKCKERFTTISKYNLRSKPLPNGNDGLAVDRNNAMLEHKKHCPKEKK
jgi:transcriptional regulator NrdR family protein